MEQEEFNTKRKGKTVLFLVLIFFAFLLLFVFVLFTVKESRKLPSLTTAKLDLAVRGDILSNDNFKIATSRKIYTATIDTRGLSPEKKELFIKLFSIYSDMDENEVRGKINKSLRNPGHLTISRNISSRNAKNLQLLAKKLITLKVFRSLKINNSHVVFGLSVFETGEMREYPYNDTLTPVIGHLRKEIDANDKTRVSGIKGLEKSYNTELNNMRNGTLKGERDVGFNIIFNRDSTITTRKDGNTLHLNIPLRLQKNIEIMLDRYKQKLGADEIVISVMESSSGNVLSLASSNRFNPRFIRASEIGNLNISAIEYQYEPGSVLKPIAISLVLEKERTSTREIFSAHNAGSPNAQGEYPRGKIKVGNWSISDDHQFKKNILTLEDIIIYSSNIGTLVLANRLSGREFLDGYHMFGFQNKSGIDLPYEKKGFLPTINQLSAGENIPGNLNIYKSTVSYGQGMTATIMQILRAYNVFNNDGYLLSPVIVHKEIPQPKEKILSDKTVQTMKGLLIKTVQEGTGRNTIYPGLEIGGKTGTANVAGRGGYQKKYMSSFFGFVNDGANRYTVGVTVNNPISTGEHWYYYYASNSAVPVFREIIEIMVKLGHLKPHPVIPEDANNTIEP